jgi:hypothetical protein
MQRIAKYWLVVALAVLVGGEACLTAHADNVRNRSRSSVNSNRNINANRNQNVNVNANRNVNVNTNRNVNVDVDVHGGYYGGCCYHEYHPVAAVAAVAVTAAVVGSIVASVPPNCSTVMVNGFAYQQCGNTWYQPQISGSSTTYVVVNPPR